MKNKEEFNKYMEETINQLKLVETSLIISGLQNETRIIKGHLESLYGLKNIINSRKE
jgi:hypothetical protein